MEFRQPRFPRLVLLQRLARVSAEPRRAVAGRDDDERPVGLFRRRFAKSLRDGLSADGGRIFRLGPLVQPPLLPVPDDSSNGPDSAGGEGVQALRQRLAEAQRNPPAAAAEPPAAAAGGLQKESADGGARRESFAERPAMSAAEARRMYEMEMQSQERELRRTARSRPAGRKRRQTDRGKNLLRARRPAGLGRIKAASN